MSLIWKIVLQGEDVNGLLFTKSSTTEAKCNVCSKFLPTPNRGPANLKFYLAVHLQYKKVLEEMEKTERLKKAALQKGLSKLAIVSVELSAFDRKVLHFIACKNLSFAVVESDTLKPLLSSNENASSSWRCQKAGAISSERLWCSLFSSDIWSGQFVVPKSLMWKEKGFMACRCFSMLASKTDWLETTWLGSTWLGSTSNDWLGST